jgi:hypothetical protein
MFLNLLEILFQLRLTRFGKTGSYQCTDQIFLAYWLAVGQPLENYQDQTERLFQLDQPLQKSLWIQHPSWPSILALTLQKAQEF